MPVYRSLTNSKEYRRVMSVGRRARRDGVTAAAVRGESGEAVRVGLVVRVGDGGAVARNRARRRLRAAIRAAGPPAGWDIVVGGGPETLDAEFQELVMHVRGALIDTGVECG